MRAIVFEEYGGSNVLKEVAVDRPRPKAGQVLVRVKATSVNPVDIQARRGDYADLIKLPGRLGVDVAGVIEAVGDGVVGLSSGDEVFYVPRLLQNEGAYGEYHVEDADIVALKPENLSFEEAATMPLAAGTAWECLVDRARIQPGDRVLVHGGAGGVGIYAVQIARAAGAFVVATCRTEHLQFVEGIGADAVIDYRADNREKRCLEANSGRGFDIILDTVGRKTIETDLALLADFGQLVSIVDQTTPQNLIQGWAKNAALHFVLTTQRVERLNRLRDLAEHGRLKPVIEQTLPLASAHKAHDLVEAGNRRGKIVLVIGD